MGSGLEISTVRSRWRDKTPDPRSAGRWNGGMAGKRMKGFQLRDGCCIVNTRYHRTCRSLCPLLPATAFIRQRGRTLQHRPRGEGTGMMMVVVMMMMMGGILRKRCSLVFVLPSLLFPFPAPVCLCLPLFRLLDFLGGRSRVYHFPLEVPRHHRRDGGP
jgi:hypothetical protein